MAISEDSINPTKKIVGQEFGIRAVSYVIDTIIAVILDIIADYIFSPMVFMLFLFFVFPDLRQGFSFDRLGVLGSSLWGALITLSLNVIFFSLFEGKFGRTLGKVLLGLIVVQQDGTPCDMKQAFIRGLYRIIDGLFFGVVAFFSMKPPLYQRIGDKKADTIVVKAKEIGIQPKQIGWSFFLMFGLYFIISGVVQFFTTLVLIRFH